MSWFEDYFGFKESASYSEIQAEFSLDDRLYLHCSKSRFPKQYVGEFTTPSLTELKQIRDTTADSDNDAKEGIGGLRFTHEAHPLGVEPLLFNSENEGAVFQAASQFNALEMVGPGVSPRQGVSSYVSDPTQGPKCEPMDTHKGFVRWSKGHKGSPLPILNSGAKMLGPGRQN